MSEHTSHKLSTVQGTLMVLGTSIGGGMLGLPVMTSGSGFFPSACMLLLSWFFMTVTGLILAEFSCQKKRNANLLSIYSEAFPAFGAVISTLVYFLLFYSLIVAYMVALERMLVDQLPIPFCLGSFGGYLGLISVLGIFFLMSTRSWLSKVNSGLIFLMGISYCLFSLMGSKLIDFSRLTERNWAESYTALPLIFTSFGFQGTVPSLASLMEYDRKSLFKSIILGTSITLGVYLLWQATIIGAVPLHGESGLLHARTMGLDAITALVSYLPFHMRPIIILFGKLFAFSAIATSLIGVSLGMRDFIRDLFAIEKINSTSRFFLSSAVFLPATFFGLLFPSAFLLALSLAGGIGCAFLLGIMPVLTGYLGRFAPLESNGPRWATLVRSLIANRYVLLLAFLFFAGEMVGEFFFLATHE